MRGNYSEGNEDEAKALAGDKEVNKLAAEEEAKEKTKALENT